jgi:hypothetical protein
MTIQSLLVFLLDYRIVRQDAMAQVSSHLVEQGTLEAPLIW